MRRETHLFACHKFLEELGGQILICLAKVDFSDTPEIESFSNQLKDYVITLTNRIRWEEEFVFNKDEIASLFGEHFELERSGGKLIEALKELLNLPPQSRLYKGKLFYLELRKFYAVNIIHFYDEETAFLILLQARANDDEIRAIGRLLYQGMSDNDIVEILARFSPAINISEKNILDDLKSFNTINVELALPKIKRSLHQKKLNKFFRVAERSWKSSYEDLPQL